MLSIKRQLGEFQLRNDYEGFKHLIRSHPEHLYDEDGWDNWMSFSARAGQLPFVDLLVSLGVDVNAPSGSFADETALFGAASEGQLDVARWLLDRRAKINFTIDGEIRCMSLTSAIYGGHFEMVKLLVERGADVNAAGGATTPLGYASGNPEIAEYLRSKGAK